jgi:hypothetical protein
MPAWSKEQLGDDMFAAHVTSAMANLKQRMTTIELEIAMVLLDIPDHITCESDQEAHDFATTQVTTLKTSLLELLVCDNSNVLPYYANSYEFPWVSYEFI